MSDLPDDVPIDRRLNRRRPVEVGCQVVTDYDFFLLGDRILDLSDDGLLLRSDGTPAELGELVLVSFRPPGSEHWIDAEARVVRLVTGQTPGAPGIGLQLEPLPPFEQGLLAAALERADRPARAPRRRFVPVRRRHRPDDVVARRVIAVDGRGHTLPEGATRVVVVG